MDTIYALASARGKAGISVVRLSGPNSHAALAMLTELPEARRASVRRLFWQGTELDEALVIRFDAGASFTGEESVELHVHGSQAVVSAVFGALSTIPGLRMAEPGEFTRRALENGRLDLTQVEGLADLIDSETEAQRAQALRVLSGSVSERVEIWRRDMIRAAALIEATIDFADEDVPVDVKPEVLQLLGGLLEDIQSEITSCKVAERVREGFEIAIVGAPNVGKSTLLNNLAGREAALTSEVAGTTRDVIEVRMDLNGLAVTVLDTAGIRDTDDKIEALGVDLARRRADAADLRIYLVDRVDEIPSLTLRQDDIVALSKIDVRSEQVFGVSGLTGKGVSQLVDEISEVLQARSARTGVLTRERHRIALANAVIALESALIEVNKPDMAAEIVADQLRGATRVLEVMIGRIDVDALLGEIFSSFCIGK